jgi:hypothetical protein
MFQEQSIEQNKIMKTIVKSLMLLVLASTMFGCVAVPKTYIDLGKGRFASPKDDAFSNVEVTYNKADGTQTTMKIGSANGANNPAVIAATGQAQNMITQTYFQGFLSGAQIAGNYAGMAFGVPGMGSLLFNPGAVNGGMGQFTLTNLFPQVIPVKVPVPVAPTNAPVKSEPTQPTTNAPPVVPESK